MKSFPWKSLLFILVAAPIFTVLNLIQLVIIYVLSGLALLFQKLVDVIKPWREKYSQWITELFSSKIKEIVRSIKRKD